MSLLLFSLLLFGLLSNINAIYDGKDSNIADIPYVSAIINGENMVATGTLINRRYILTLDIPSLALSTSYAVLGSSKILEKPLKMMINSTIRHPDKNIKLMLICLAKEIEYDMNVLPVNLPRPGKVPDVEYVIAAFGRRTPDAEAGQLNSVQLNPADHDKCNSYKGYNKKRHVCFSMQTFEEEDGLPMIHNGTLYGIGCAQSGAQHVMTNIAPAVEWLLKVQGRTTSITTTSTTTIQTTSTTPLPSSSSSSTSTDSGRKPDARRNDACRNANNLNFDIFIFFLFVTTQF